MNRSIPPLLLDPVVITAMGRGGWNKSGQERTP